MVQHMDPHMVASGQPCLNQFDCPLLTLTKVIRVLFPAAIVRAISVVHQCTSTCVVDSMHIAARMERQRVSENTLRLKHDCRNSIVIMFTALQIMFKRLVTSEEKKSLDVR